jgi:uncharacterized membrane protein YeiH
MRASPRAISFVSWDFLDIPLHALSADFVLPFIEAAAVLISAIAGMILAANKRMDIVGAYALAVLNAFGGGTVRDLLLDNRPFYWMRNWELLVVILALCVAFVYNSRIYNLANEVSRRSVRVDAIGLALFTITGVGIALAQDRPLIVAVLMGVVTGTMGGMLRDIVVNELPDLFRPGALYATASFTGGLAFIAALENGLRYTAASAIGIFTIVALRLASTSLGVRVPAPHWADEDERRR